MIDIADFQRRMVEAREYTKSLFAELSSRQTSVVRSTPSSVRSAGTSAISE